jgi:hypothetical protein
MIIGKAEGVVAVEPAMPGVPALIGFADGDHGSGSCAQVVRLQNQTNGKRRAKARIFFVHPNCHPFAAFLLLTPLRLATLIAAISRRLPVFLSPFRPLVRQ